MGRSVGGNGASGGLGANRSDAQRQAILRNQAHEARHLRYGVRSSVRSLRTGQRLHIYGAPLADLNVKDHRGLNVIASTHFGINNLPKQAKDSIAQLLGDVAPLLGQMQAELQGGPSTTNNASNNPFDIFNNASNGGSINSHQPSFNLSQSTDLTALSSLTSPSSLCGMGTPSQFQAMPLDHSAALAQATQIGYANVAELLEAQTPWRPWIGHAGMPRPTAPGSQTAIVVGPNGTETDTSAGDVYMDRLGRIRIRMHWQGQLADGDGSTSGVASCWVRVVQRSAGAGMGLQFIPRVGQEVLVQFLGGDIDKPIAMGALYNGQGVGGVKPTTAGAAAKENKDNPFATSHDTRAAAQGNLMAAGTGGKSPAWFGSVHGKHGESEGSLTSGGQANSAAQWGIRTKEWSNGGNSDLSSGYNQLVFDDNDTQGGNQQRIQLKTTQAATELSLGHLIHTADNHRGSLRGLGFELRTDAYGAVRAGAGLHLSTYSIHHSMTTRDPVGDNAGAISLLKQAMVLSEAFSKAAGTHSTVKLASVIGSIEANQSGQDDKASPLKALHKMAATQVNSKTLDAAVSDAANKSTAPKADTLPHSGDAILSLAGQGGITAVAGQSLQFSNSETISMMSGQDSQTITGGAMRMHTGQAIGILAGAVDKGEEGKGLTLVASKDPIRYEAQSDQIDIAAKGLINIQSANSHIDWAAAKSITIRTEGGASITIEGGNITIECPGKLTVHATKKSFDGPARISYESVKFSTVDLIPTIKFSLQSHGGNGMGITYAHEPYTLFADGGMVEQGLSDENGNISFKHKIGARQYKVELISGQVFEIDALINFAEGAMRENQILANQGFRDEPTRRFADEGFFKTEKDQRASVQLTQNGQSATKKGGA